MKKISMLCVLFPVFLMAQASPPIQTLTLADVREAVLANNPSIRESLQRILAAEAVLKQAESPYLPTLTLKGSYNSFDTSTHPEVDIEHRYEDSFDIYGGSLRANWLIFDGFARRARKLSAAYNVDRRELLADDTRRLLLLSATVSFRQAQLAIENIQVLEQDKQFNRILEKDAYKRFEAGAVPESDVFNFSIRVLQAESLVFQAQLDYDIACSVLAELMALPEGRLPENMRPAPVSDEAPTREPSVDLELQYALTHRPDYKATEAGWMALEQQVKVSKGKLMPSLALIGDVSYFENEGVATADNYGDYISYVGVGLQWDLFSGGRNRGEIRESEAEMRALGEQRESLRLSIRSAIQKHIDQARTAREVFETQKQIYELSLKVRDSVTKAYNAGVASITRLNEVQTDTTRSEGALAASRINSLLTLELLDAETGRILDRRPHK
ncbi:TolC family protein [Kiritimatiellota bacterium B12222]|nr:TolC family protein [Kiritimatiellota bacterium B12222]